MRKPRSVVAHYINCGLAGVPMPYYAPDLVGMITAGLPVEELGRLQVALGLSQEKLCAVLSLSKATLHRYKNSAGRLAPEVSDRLVRYARLLGFAARVFESADYARAWLNCPQYGLGGAEPLDFARTEVGAREVEDLLGRILYGVFS